VNGLSTSCQLLEIQEDLMGAKTSEGAAVIGYRRALTAFRLSTGELLDSHSIKLQDEEATDAE